MAHDWSVGEDWAALHLYLRLGGGLEEYEPAVIALDNAMGDGTPESIVARVRNFAYLDLGSGESHPAQQTRAVWAEYEEDPEQGGESARMAYEALTGQTVDC